MTMILCIEDEPHIREIIAEEMKDAGYDVTQARDGIEGLEMINRYKPDLVLCDITMPRKNGYELMKEIREEYPIFAEMPFIFLTALADRDRVLTGMKDGADAYLTKPIDFEMLRATVLASLRQIERIRQNKSSHAPGIEGECVSESAKQVEQLQGELKSVSRESLTDSLTGVANRKCFDRMLDQDIAHAKKMDQSLSLLMIDIDHFKRFKDTFGHQTGDTVLKLVAGMLKSIVRDFDHVARYGGEEFAVILQNTNLEQALKIAERIRQSLMTKKLVIRSTGQSLGEITLSIGVGSLKPEDSAQSLIEHADACLNAAKHAGHNRVLCETNLPNNDTDSGECAA